MKNKTTLIYWNKMATTGQVYDAVTFFLFSLTRVPSSYCEMPFRGERLFCIQYSACGEIKHGALAPALCGVVGCRLGLLIIRNYVTAARFFR